MVVVVVVVLVIVVSVLLVLVVVVVRVVVVGYGCSDSLVCLIHINMIMFICMMWERLSRATRASVVRAPLGVATGLLIVIRLSSVPTFSTKNKKKDELSGRTF